MSVVGMGLAFLAGLLIGQRGMGEGKVLSVADLLPYGLQMDEITHVLRSGGLLRVWRLQGLDALSTDPDHLEGLCRELEVALGSLRGRWAVHWHHFRTPARFHGSKGAFPDGVSASMAAERMAHLTSGKVGLETEIFLSITRLPDAQAERWAWRLFVAGEDVPTATEQEIWAEHVRKFNAGVETLRGSLAPLRGQALGYGELLGFFYQALTGRRQVVQAGQDGIPTAPMVAADLFPGFRPVVGGLHVRVISVRSYPDLVHTGLVDLVNGIGEACTSVQRFRFMDDQAARARLHAAATSWWNTGFSARDDGPGSQEVFENRLSRSRARDAVDAREYLDRGGRFGLYTWVLLVHREDPAVADEAAREICSALRAHGLVVAIERVNAVSALFGAQPGDVTTDVRTAVMPLNAAVRMAPITQSWSGHEDAPHPALLGQGPLLLTTGRGGTPFGLNIHVKDVGHTAVVGPTGAGKSVLLQLLAAGFLRYRDARVFYLDVGSSAKLLAYGLGASIYRLKAGRQEGGLKLQPLRACGEAAVEWVATLARVNGVSLDIDEMGELRRCLELLGRAAPERRTVGGLRSLVQTDRLKRLLGLYSDGEVDLFEGTADILGSAPFVHFELGELLAAGDHISIPALQWILQRIESSLDPQRQALIVIDEAWSALARHDLHDWLERALRTYRKRGGSVVFATQSLEDASGKEGSALMLESITTHFFLPNPRATTKSRVLYQGLGLGDTEIDLIANAVPRREYFLRNGDGVCMVDLGLASMPIARAFLTPEPGLEVSGTLEAVEALMARSPNAWRLEWLERRGCAVPRDLALQISAYEASLLARVPPRRPRGAVA